MLSDGTPRGRSPHTPPGPSRRRAAAAQSIRLTSELEASVALKDEAGAWRRPPSSLSTLTAARHVDAALNITTVCVCVPLPLPLRRGRLSSQRVAVSSETAQPRATATTSCSTDRPRKRRQTRSRERPRGLLAWRMTALPQDAVRGRPRLKPRSTCDLGTAAMAQAVPAGLLCPTTAARPSA